jgi:proline iminopeptidase
MRGTHDDVGVVQVEGAQLRYSIEGQGTPVLVVASAVFYPRIFSRHLRDDLRLVFADLRHFGISDGSFPVERISIDTIAADIERVRESLDLGRVVVLGHSTAGCMALEYARRYPEHVLGAVTMCSYPHIDVKQPDPYQQLWEAEASQERKDLLARNLAALTDEALEPLSPSERFVAQYNANAPIHWFDPTVDAAALWDGVEIDIPVFEQTYGLFGAYDIGQGPGEITVPVLIVQGRYDYGAPYTEWEHHRHKLRHHTYARFERSGHYVSLEEPETFDQTLLAWVRSLANT